MKIDELRPPSGVAEVVGREPIAFVGWLGLMGAIADLFPAGVEEAGEAEEEDTAASSGPSVAGRS